MVKNLPCNVGDVSSITGHGTKILCPVGYLSPCSASRACEPKEKIPHDPTKILRAATKT